MKRIILFLFLALATFCQAQFTPFDPSKSIDSPGNYMGMDTMKYEVSYTVKKTKSKAEISQITVDEFGNKHRTDLVPKDTTEARAWIEANISLHDSIISKIDTEFLQMEQMQQYIRQEMDKIINQKKALRRERIIAERSKKSLQKIKL